MWGVNELKRGLAGFAKNMCHLHSMALKLDLLVVSKFPILEDKWTFLRRMVILWLKWGVGTLLGINELKCRFDRYP